jgi:hypothetical protein
LPLPEEKKNYIYVKMYVYQLENTTAIMTIDKRYLAYWIAFFGEVKYHFTTYGLQRYQKLPEFSKKKR